MHKGKLIGVGTGPGDPELVSRKAWSRISHAKVIAYPAADSGTSFARSIVSEAISDDVLEIEMKVPMRTGRKPAQDIYDEGASAISAQLDKGHDVVVLCEGDPLFYGSFMYILARLRDAYEVEVVPGITAMTACASAMAHPLVAREDMMTIMPRPFMTNAHSNCLVSRCRYYEGRTSYKSFVTCLLRCHADNAIYVSHASLPHQVSCALVDAPDDAPYFSMILLYKGDDPWI